MKYALIVILFVLMRGQCFSQNIDTSRLTVEYAGAKASQVLDDLQKLTGYSFYYNAAELDSILVNISQKNQSLSAILSSAFNKTGVNYSIDDSKHVFISKKKLIRTSLPESFLDPTKTDQTDVLAKETSGRKNRAVPSDTVARASLDNKLYEIGDRKATPPRQVVVDGYVKDARTGEPISGVSIEIEKLKTGTTTDDYGYFSLSLPPGRHTLNIESIGMSGTQRMVMLYSDGKMDIELKGEVTTLRNVVVSAQKVCNVKGSQMGMQKIDIASIKKVPVIFGESDVLRAVISMPGVKTVGEASTGLNVRGGSADQNLILLNEATIFNPSHFFGMFSAFNPDIVKDVTLYKGNIPARFGGRLSSVLDISTRGGNKKNLSGSAGIGPLTSRITLEGPITKEKISFIAGARSTYATWLLNLLPDEYKNSKAGFYDANLSLTNEINKNNTIYLSGYISRDRFNLNSDTTYHYGNKSVSLKWKHIFSNKLNSLFITGFDKYNYESSSSKNNLNGYKMNFDIAQAYLRTHFNYYLNSSHTIDFGINTTYYDLNPGRFEPVNEQSFVVPDTLAHEFGFESAVYVNDRFNLSPDLSFEGGVRLSMYSTMGGRVFYKYPNGVPRTEENIVDSSYFGRGFVETYVAPEIRLSVRYSLNSDLSVKAGFNTQRQYIHMLSNTAAMAPTDIWKLSDRNIKPQKGAQASAGLYKNFKNNTIETSLEVYYKWIRDYLDYKSGANLLMNRHIETDVFNTKGKAYGVEFMIKKPAGKFNGWLSYTWSRILLRQNDPLAGEVINKGNYYPANYDKPRDVSLIANYRFSHRVSMSMNVNYSTGRPITMPIGKYYFSGSYRTLFAERNAHRIPDYFRADISMNIEGNHRLKQKTHNSWTLGVYNLTARKNPYSVYYISEGGTINGYKLSIFGSAIPFVTYNIRF